VTHRLPWLVAGSFLLFACGSKPEFELETPHPVTVTPVLSTYQAAGAITPGDGGIVTATGSDGTQYTLDVPAGAVVEPVEIGLIPVTSIGGLPFSGGLQAAVQIEPDGLQLYKLATLTIIPAKSVPHDDQIGFGYHGSGDEFHLQPIGKVGLTFPVVILMGYGGGRGTGADVSAQMAKPPTSSEDQLSQTLEQNFFNAGYSTSPTFVCTPSPTTLAELQSFYTTVIVPAYNAAQMSTNIGNGLVPCTPTGGVNIINEFNLMAWYYLQCQAWGDLTDASSTLTDMNNLANQLSNLADADVLANCNSPTFNFYGFLGMVLSLQAATNTTSPPETKLESDIAMCTPCKPPCPAPQICCQAKCVDPTSDPNNCAACGRVCASGKCCKANCTLGQFDPLNCGGCGIVCTGVIPACCSQAGNPTAVMCTDLDSDNSNCGTCGTICIAGHESCQKGKCVPMVMPCTVKFSGSGLPLSGTCVAGLDPPVSATSGPQTIAIQSLQSPYFTFSATAPGLFDTTPFCGSAYTTSNTSCSGAALKSGSDVWAQFDGAGQPSVSGCSGPAIACPQGSFMLNLSYVNGVVVDGTLSVTMQSNPTSGLGNATVTATF
jgi:hypothetical protein